MRELLKKLDIEKGGLDEKGEGVIVPEVTDVEKEQVQPEKALDTKQEKLMYTEFVNSIKSLDLVFTNRGGDGLSPLLEEDRLS